MPDLADPGHTVVRRLRVALSAALLGAMAIGIAVLGIGVMRQIDSQSGANSDNVQWSLSQVDVELLTLNVALDDAVESRAALDIVRQRFDIFYSRVNMLRAGSVFANLRQNQDFIASSQRRFRPAAY